MKEKFSHGDKVKLVGKDNPFAGEEGIFVQYEKKYVEEERLLVLLNSDGKTHYFYGDEVKDDPLSLRTK